MSTIILYGSPTKLSKAHAPVRRYSHHPNYYVRMETCSAETAESALGSAKPKEGETVLNTLEIP